MRKRRKAKKTAKKLPAYTKEELGRWVRYQEELKKKEPRVFGPELRKFLEEEKEWKEEMKYWRKGYKKRKDMELELHGILGIKGLRPKWLKSERERLKSKSFRRGIDSIFLSIPSKVNEKILLKAGAKKKNIPKLSENEVIKKYLEDISESVDRFVVVDNRYTKDDIILRGRKREIEKVKRLMASLERTIKRT